MKLEQQLFSGGYTITNIPLQLFPKIWRQLSICLKEIFSQFGVIRPDLVIN